MKKNDAVKNDNVISIIGPGVEINGIINAQGSMRIDGRIKGDVIAEGDVVIGDSGNVTGTVKGKNLTMAGRVEGAVTAEEKLILEASAKLQGDLTTKILVIESGAKFDGSSAMTRKAKKE